MDGDVGKGSQGVRAVGGAAPLHMAKTEEVNRESGREICRVHSIGCGEAVEKAAVGYCTRSADTTDGEW